MSVHELFDLSADIGELLYGSGEKRPASVIKGILTEEVVGEIRTYLLENHSDLFTKSVLDPNVRPLVRDKIDEYVRLNGITVAGFSLEQLVERLAQEICGLGQLDVLLVDNSVTDILVYGPEEVYVIRNGRTEKTDIRFRNDEHVLTIARKLLNAAGESVTVAKPVVDARLPDCRVNIAIPPVARLGTSIIIRKFPPTNLNEENLTRTGLMSAEMLEFFKVVMRGSVNGVICGPTGSGKTTTLKELIRFVPDEDRIMTIEDTEEMRLKLLYPAKIVDPLECRFTDREETTIDMSVLLKAALRRTPKRIFPGEVRGPEAATMIEILNTGHYGFTTLHANSAKDAVTRLVLMMMRANMKMDEDAIGKLVASTIDIIIFQKRLRDGRFRILEVAELVDYENKKPVINMLYKFRVTGIGEKGEIEGLHERVGRISEELAERLLLDGIPEEEIKPFVQGGNLR